MNIINNELKDMSKETVTTEKKKSEWVRQLQQINHKHNWEHHKVGKQKIFQAITIENCPKLMTDSKSPQEN